MMPILQTHFFHNTVQLYVGAFGSIFDEIKIHRDDGKFILVPIAYTNKRPYEVRNTENPEPTKSNYKLQLPRMSFALKRFYRDTTRVLNPLEMMIQPGDRNTGLNAQRQRVPYNFQFTLNIKTKTIIDMLQILEQIMVYFNPSITINVLDNPDLDMENSLPVKMLNSDDFGDVVEGSFENETVIETSIDFELEGYLYMPTGEAKVIKTVFVNYYDALHNNQLIDTQTFTEDDLP